MQRNVFVEKGFNHILGPSPAIVPGGKDAWDGWILESCDIFKDGHTYYWYYHGRGDQQRYPKGYRVGVATAPDPLGPWVRYEGNPVLDYGPAGSWDEESVDCACVMKEGAYDLPPDKQTYYMWYAAGGKSGRHIGLATSNSPLGPWKKHEANPVVEDFGYLGSVVKVNGTFYMYTQYPVGITDQGAYCVATADRPEGPWTKYDGNPILVPGDWGAWDDGGFSEAGVRYNDGVFHWFYGGTKTLKLESIGYAYSFDGYNFSKYSGNPVIPLHNVPDAAGFAEVKTLIEPPFVYLYHTLRYQSRNPQEWTEWETEDLGIQVLSINPTYRIAVPILNLGSLGPGAESTLEQCCPVSMENASEVAVTIEARFSGSAAAGTDTAETNSAGLRLHIRSSYDGRCWDSEDLHSIDIEPGSGGRTRKSVALYPKTRFFKVICENLDSSASVTSLRLTATVGG